MASRNMVPSMLASIFGPVGLDNLRKAGWKNLPKLAKYKEHGHEIHIGELKDVRLRKGWEQVLLWKEKKLSDILDFSSPQGRRLTTAYPGIQNIPVTNEDRGANAEVHGSYRPVSVGEQIWLNPRSVGTKSDHPLEEQYDTILHEGINHAIFSREPSFQGPNIATHDLPSSKLTPLGYAMNLNEVLASLASRRGAERAKTGRGAANSAQFAEEIFPETVRRARELTEAELRESQGKMLVEDVELARPAAPEGMEPLEEAPVPVNLDIKGGDTRRDIRAAEEAGDTEVPDTPLEEPVPQATEPVPEGGPRIVINPEVFEDKRDALCVAMNEAFRVLMEVNGFNPVSEPTDAQRRFFADTAYSQNENQMRRTILARICTFDTSVKDPTEEQLAESVEFLEAVMEMGAPQNEWEQQAVQRIHDVLVAAIEKGTSAGGTSTEEPPAPEDVQEGDPRGEQAAVGGGVSDRELDKIGQGRGGHFQNARGQTVAAWNNTARDSAGRIVRRSSTPQADNGENAAADPDGPNEFVAQFMAGEAGGNPTKPPEEPNEFVAQFMADEAGGNPADSTEEPNEFVLYNQDSSLVDNDTHSQGERETFLKERGMDTELAKTATMDQLVALHTKQVEDGIAPSGSDSTEEPNEFVLYNQDSSLVDNDTHSQGERETFLKERGMDTGLAKTATMDQLVALHTKQVEDGIDPSGSVYEEEEIG